MPKFFLDLLTTIVLEDTAYRELLNCMLLRLQGEMNKAWNPKVKHNFPMYISMYESFMPFFMEWMRVKGGGKVVVEVAPDKEIIKFKTNKTKPIRLNEEVVKRIKGLNKDDQKRFYKEINELIFRLIKG